ncbi:YegS/Rv2252/BmrU family lipid kinase [Deinobacterium chartae]|uniref:YegS/Rv2252/BmrU family lipid kinase n=1 Tax=Deinobacterium chartae TaxID=521158 RepID=A0A841HXJ9_9DEIO|nr:YegS/Rv2252/BmrU family lipid kinase [Deinobacterium chartae]MBB6097626.1 YegS/Rv2252/BmrU family lipid kinase [Deinobacterium chartae]
MPLKPVRASLLINLHARRGAELIEQAESLLRARGLDLEAVHAVRSPEQAETLMRRDLVRGVERLIVGGGDGTLSHAAGVLAGTGAVMGVLPLGSGNTWARSLGLPLDLEGAAGVVAQGEQTRVDVGVVNGRVFLNSVALGVSAALAGSLDRQTKRRLGLLAWPLRGVGVLRGHRPLYLRVRTAERTFELRTHQLVISNGRYVAGPIKAAPDASAQDARLEVFALGGAELPSFVRATLDWLRGRHPTSALTEYLETREVRVENLSRRPAQVSVDGEVGLQPPLEVRVWPRALWTMVPPGFRADQA